MEGSAWVDDLPSFSTKAEFCASPWRPYLEARQNFASQTRVFPLCFPVADRYHPPRPLRLGAIFSFPGRSDVPLDPSQSVYGRSTSFDFPLSMRKFTFFYRNILPAAAKSSLAWYQGSPTTGDLISSVDGWFDPSAAGTAGPGASYGAQSQPIVHSVWVYMYPSAGCPHGSWPHASPSFVYSAGFASNTTVEVMHTCCDNER